MVYQISVKFSQNVQHIKDICPLNFGHDRSYVGLEMSLFPDFYRGFVVAFFYFPYPIGRKVM
jgi:hypothetical protein